MRQYTVLEVLGRGGFGKVVRARFDGPRGFTRQVAIKLLLPSSNTERNAEALRRLRDEARLLGLLQHRALVAVDRLAIIDGEWSVVMEYVAGVDGERLISGGPMPVRPAFEIVHEIADVLDHAWHVPGPEGHALRLLHRDIKPGNFLLTADGLVKVLDLGIARAEFAAREALTEDVSFGTPAYMAPERMRGIEVHQGDVYSLGCVLYALLKGEPFGRSGLSLRPHTQHRNERMDALHEARPDVPVEALTLLAELLAFDPDERPSAGVLATRCLALSEMLPAPSLRAFAREAVPRLRAEQKAKHSAEIGSVLREEAEGAIEVSSGSVMQAERVETTSRPHESVVAAPPPVAPRVASPPRPPPAIVRQELDETAPQPTHTPAQASAQAQVQVQVEERGGRSVPRAAMIAAPVSALALVLIVWLGSGWTEEPPGPPQANTPPPPGSPADEPGMPEDGPAPAVSAEPPVEAATTPTQQLPRSTDDGPAPRAAAGAASAANMSTSTRASPAVNVHVKGGVPVTLDLQGQRIDVPGAVIPGKYRILATFDGTLEPAGNLIVPATGRVTINCDASTLMCASTIEP